VGVVPGVVVVGARGGGGLGGLEPRAGRHAGAFTRTGAQLVQPGAGLAPAGEGLAVGVDLGVAEVFGPGASMDEMIEFVREQVPERR
jgi:methylmalonyl-CoA mutase cobalamin-binding subunit